MMKRETKDEVIKWAVLIGGLVTFFLIKLLVIDRIPGVTE